MKKKLGIALMVLGLLGVGVGVAHNFSTSHREDCLRFRAEAVALADKAVAAQGTPQEQALMEESQSQSDWADMACASADETRQITFMILAAGLVLGMIGFVLFRAGKGAAAGQGS